jgi:hypothetical protein
VRWERGVDHRLTEGGGSSGVRPLPGRKHSKRMLGVDDADPRWGTNRRDHVS